MTLFPPRFQGCTLLCIAHRLQTVIQMDRLVVMHAGTLAEFDTASKLLEDPCSQLSQMVAATGTSTVCRHPVHCTPGVAAHCTSNRYPLHP